MYLLFRRRSKKRSHVRMFAGVVEGFEEPGLGDAAGAEDAFRTATALLANNCGGMRQTIAGRDVVVLRQSCFNGLVAVLNDALAAGGAGNVRAVVVNDLKHAVRGLKNVAMAPRVDVMLYVAWLW